jgi:hypothetical protein
VEIRRTIWRVEKSNEAEKIFDTWFAPAKRPFRTQPD